ncbi:serine/threonine-protein phosphatase 4 regulatory subunit 1 isoform X3 [Microplitis demolitor]|uniref:serine/threonine-protein phosphatase 4 regulatory subunit 1 isoform X3 n=1 Tax=Microplitis demolitor TaxID=69319 RepID=UPI0004CD6910|nr:serine/threonine-protein phosphatase 4 regulatory subunit 1 isoform X3 [Microplitis demolitor]
MKKKLLGWKIFSKKNLKLTVDFCAGVCVCVYKFIASVKMSHDPEYSCGMPLEPAKTVLTQSGGMYFDQVDLDEEMANRMGTEIDSGNSGYDQQRDGEGDRGGGDEGGGYPYPLHPMARLQQYATCELPYNRQLVGRILVEIFRGAIDNGTDLNVTEVMQPVHKLVHDTESAVRLELVEQLPHVAMICQEAPDKYGDILSTHLIHIIVSFLQDTDQQVRQSTHTALLTLIERGLLDKNSVENVVAPTLLMMGTQPAKLEYINFAIDGMSKVASILEPQTAERLFLQRYLSLCTDINFFIRKLCAIHFGEFSTAMSKETMYDILLPAYINLCKDPVWTVRKSCAEVIVSVACCVPIELRRTTLSTILASHLEDESKWVRLSAYQMLGPFISTFAKKFTGIAYNHYGELILTDQHGTELRYNMVSFAGSGESAMSCKSASDEDYDQDNEMMNNTMSGNNQEDNVDKCRRKMGGRSKIYQKIVAKERAANLPKKQWSSLGSLNKTSNYEDSADEDHHQFNSFLYYYIPPPDLPPLDNDLIEINANGSSAVGENLKDQDDSLNESTDGKIKTETEETETVTETGTDTDRNSLDNSDTPRNNTDVKPSNEINSNDFQDSKEIKNEKNNETEKNPCYKDDKDNEQDNGQYEDEDKDLLNNSQNNSTDDYKLMSETISISNTSLDYSNFESSDTKQRNNYSVNPSDSDNNQTIVPQELINFFVSMAEPEAWWNSKWNNAEIPRFCAFYFPAVVLTLGKENWPMLKTAYGYLSDAREYKVRRTMASSIHEVAMILGEELSAQDLLPIYDGFIKDLDEVRISALKHLATFLKVLKPADRCHFLPRLKAFLSIDNESNWRFREEVACRLLESVSLYSTNDVAKYIAPLSFPLLVDKVAAVRQMALELVTQIISYLSSDDSLVTTIIQELRSMLTASSSRWTCRQTFALLCASLISKDAISGEKFSSELLPWLLDLSSDVVPNVRLAVIRTLTTQVVNISNILSEEEVELINNKVQISREDPDRDVRAIAGGSVGKYQAFKWPEVRSIANVNNKRQLDGN